MQVSVSHDSCAKRFQWTHKEVDLAPHPVVGLVLQVEDTEKFAYTVSFVCLQSQWCRTARSWLVRPLLVLLRQS